MENCNSSHLYKVFPNQSESASKTFYHYDVNNDTDFMFNFEREFYVAVYQNEKLTKSDLVEFTLNINGDTVTSIVSRNNCVINCTSNGYCVYNIPDIATYGIEDGPAIVDLEFDGIDHCAAGILVTDNVIETSLDLARININDITVITDSGEYQCSLEVQDYNNTVHKYQLRSDEFGKSEMSFVKWLEIRKKGKSSSNGENIRNDRTRPLETTNFPTDNEDLQAKKARTSSPLTDFPQYSAAESYSEGVRSFSHHPTLSYGVVH
ncbi:hypothetical protein SNE40_003754 [Patella caerulea]|uniref:Uncharacterized protein n=1 Tax=Patella caerulea TaxID=87958 RepID=A0AAN8KBX5_PATCE